MKMYFDKIIKTIKEANFTNNMPSDNYNKITELDVLLKKNPNNINLLMQKAYIYADGYDDKNAISIYKKIIASNPNYVDAYFWLSYYLWQIGHSFEPIKIAKEGLKIDPNRADLHLIIAWSNTYEDGNKDEFLFHIKKAIELEPTWITTRISLIYYLIKNKQFDEVKKEINEAIKQLNYNLSEPNNEMEYRYEYYVTGRLSSKSNKEFLEKSLKDIEFAKN